MTRAALLQLPSSCKRVELPVFVLGNALSQGSPSLVATAKRIVAFCQPCVFFEGPGHSPLVWLLKCVSL